MTFTQLLALVTSSQQDKPNIHCDSRAVKEGDCFVALSGTHVDGHDFIAEALKRGAKYIVCQKAPEDLETTNAEIIVVEDSSEALGVLSQAYFGNPSLKLTNLAVTGTNGKTTVSYLARSILHAADKKCALLGTIVYDTAESSIDASLTTPDPLQIAALSRKAVDEGAEFLIMEASSHALAQNRLAGVNFTAAAFTNLTGDHLDYHKSTEQYLAAKTRLFTTLPPHGIAVLNADSPFTQKIADKIDSRILYYSTEDAEAHISCRIELMDINQTSYKICFNNFMERVTTTLCGEHNISNQLAAAGLCLAAGLGLSTIAIGLSALDSVPGRLEPVDCGQDFTVLVDYAHTDDALKNVLNTLRPLCKNNLTVVFGCGGDRDKTKRPRMAQVAEQLADKIFVTSDNPRTEEPLKIIQDITEGFADPNDRRITVLPDRKQAIQTALESARADDIVLIAGKGHETYQIIGTEKIDFDDRKIVRACLKEIK
jgi:UDP-N-acetylmuramoyl-L-alanyl-D-glutamate--2,6-diaminopimelate ligase